MRIAIFYVIADSQDPRVEFFSEGSLLDALKRTEELRRAGNFHVCLSTEFSHSIGKPGVSSVQDGKTPDGVEYTWVKRR